MLPSENATSDNAALMNAAGAPNQAASWTVMLPPRRRWRMGLVAALALLAGVWLGWPVRSGGRQLAPVVPPEALHFGEVWSQTDFPLTLPLRNPSPHDVEIVEFRCAPCGCCQYDPPALVIPAGEERTVRLTVDLSPRREERKLAVCDFRVEVSARLRGNNAPMRRWEMSGRVRNAVWFEPSRIDYGAAVIEDAATPSRIVTIHPHFPLDELKAGCESNLLRCEVERDPGDPARFRLQLQTASSLPPGPLAVAVWVKATLPSGESLPRIAYQVQGDVQANVYATPSSIALGCRRVGEQAEQSIELKSHTGDRFSVVGATSSTGALEPSDELATANDARVDGGMAFRSRYRFRFQQPLTAVGRLEGQVAFEVVRSAGRRARLIVPMYGHVVPGGAAD